MFRRLNKISIKYGAAFISVALALLIVVIMDQLLLRTVEYRMEQFSGPFAVATSAILNADRDLYQARVATLQNLNMPSGSKQAVEEIEAHHDNAQSSYDRLHKFKKIWSDYPKVVATLGGFETAYDKWSQQVQKVYDLHAAGSIEAARKQSDGPAKEAFSNLRNFYDVAGEAGDAEIQALSEETKQQVSRSRYIVTAISAIAIIFAFIIALVGPAMVSRAIREVTQRIKEVTDGDGDLTARINSTRHDEIGDLADRFNEFISMIDGMLQSIRNNTESVTHAATEIALGSQELSKRTENSAANLEQTSATMEEITATVRNTADASTQGNELAQSVVTVAREGEQTMQDMARTMDEISKSASQISEFTSMIDGIAFQTNLLALNASVEAARAGEHGRGFAVVAEEVRTLAGRAGDASRDVRQLVETSESRTQAGSELVNKTGQKMREIVQGIERVTEVINEISTGAEEQSNGISEINTAVSELESATQQNSALVEQTTAAATQASEQAKELSRLIGIFRLSDSAPENVATKALPAPVNG